MDKNGYCENDVFIFAWDLGVIFFGHTKLVISRFLENKIKFLSERCHKKNVWVVSLYNYF